MFWSWKGRLFSPNKDWVQVVVQCDALGLVVASASKARWQSQVITVLWVASHVKTLNHTTKVTLCHNANLTNHLWKRTLIW